MRNKLAVDELIQHEVHRPVVDLPEGSLLLRAGARAWQNVLANTGGDSGGSLLDRLPGQVGVARGRLRLLVSGAMADVYVKCYG